MSPTGRTNCGTGVDAAEDTADEIEVIVDPEKSVTLPEVVGLTG